MTRTHLLGIALGVLVAIGLGLNYVAHERDARKAIESTAWTEYANTSLGFSFSYPAQYVLQEHANMIEGEFAWTALVDVYDPTKEQEVAEFSVPAIHVSVYAQPIESDGPVFSSLEEYADYLDADRGNIEIINGTKVLRAQSTDDPELAVDPAFYWFLKDGFLYFVELDQTSSYYGGISNSLRF